MDSRPPKNDFTGTELRRGAGGPRVLAHRQRLLALAGADRGQQWEIEGPRVVVGSAPTADVVLTDPLVSRQHCVIEAIGGRHRVRDLESTNGTFIDGQRVTVADLEPGGRLHVGDTELLFEPKLRSVAVKQESGDRVAGLVGGSQSLCEARALLGHVGASTLGCLLVGETGTGKDVAARALHDASARRAGPFVVLDCAAISPTLVESELFGHEKGAFTGADRARVGAFEAASGGTLFLDEIGELPIGLQPKLLRALERREIKRLGSTSYLDVDVRVVAATHRDLPSWVETGAFRADLLYRVAEIVVALPPLRERPEDLGALVEHFLTSERASDRSFDRDALAALGEHAWPGNVRELRNVVRRVIAITPSRVVSAADVRRAIGAAFPIKPSARAPVGEGRLVLATEGPADETLEAARARWNDPLDAAWLAKLLERSGGDLSKAATLAAVHPKSLERLLRKHGLKKKGRS
ncbi:MAG: sigma 54-interacting transcriptional regulator [Deltaproteobacteria bacterium]|nr:sigma 54-interacting transcriptional regulator [Deltaproteobacteria bacterium]